MILFISGRVLRFNIFETDIFPNLRDIKKDALGGFSLLNFKKNTSLSLFDEGLKINTIFNSRNVGDSLFWPNIKESGWVFAKDVVSVLSVSDFSDLVSKEKFITFVVNEGFFKVRKMSFKSKDKILADVVDLSYVTDNVFGENLIKEFIVGGKRINVDDMVINYNDGCSVWVMKYCEEKGVFDLLFSKKINKIDLF